MMPPSPQEKKDRGVKRILAGLQPPPPVEPVNAMDELFMGMEPTEEEALPQKKRKKLPRSPRTSLKAQPESGMPLVGSEVGQE